MSVVTPKTIVITAMPNKSQLSGLGGGTSSNAMVESLLESGPRKRRRLTHLTPEERMLRRKLKNRVAAQTARDRKKARMTELEEAVAELEAENNCLIKENDTLREHTSDLMLENNKLKKQLSLLASSGAVKLEKSDTRESAVLHVPLPQGQVQALFQLTAHCVAFLLTMSLTCSLGCCSKSLMTPGSSLSKSVYRDPVITPAQKHNPTVRWWGPQQQSWNPSMN